MTPRLVEPAHHLAVAAAEVLALAGAREAAGDERFESDEQAPQPRGRGLFDQVVVAGSSPPCGRLEDAAHPAHAAEQIAGEPGVPEEMIVQEVEVSPGRRAISASASSTRCV